LGAEARVVAREEGATAAVREAVDLAEEDSAAGKVEATVEAASAAARVEAVRAGARAAEGSAAGSVAAATEAARAEAAQAAGSAAAGSVAGSAAAVKAAADLRRKKGVERKVRQKKVCVCREGCGSCRPILVVGKNVRSCGNSEF
jgi:hypothetical protein